jgi:hypothetical protein
VRYISPTRYGTKGGSIVAIPSVLMKCPMEVKMKKRERPTLARVTEAVWKLGIHLPTRVSIK